MERVSIIPAVKAKSLRQVLAEAKAGIECLIENADANDNQEDEFRDEIQKIIDAFCEARSKISGPADCTRNVSRSNGSDSPCERRASHNAQSNDADELKKQLRELQEKHERNKQQWEEEKLRMQTQLDTIKIQKATPENSLDQELLETIYELKEELQSTRKAIQSTFSTEEDEHIQFLGNGFREIRSSVDLALAELRQASNALKQTLVATRESLTEMHSAQLTSPEKRLGSPSKQAHGTYSDKVSVQKLQKQLEIEIKKRIRAEAEVEILNDQADAYMDQILELQTENVQLILKADESTRRVAKSEPDVSALVPTGMNPDSDGTQFHPKLDESTSWDTLPAFVRNLYERCEMLEAERQEVLESTVELLESSREANQAKVEAAYNEAMAEAERNFRAWLDHAVCEKCSSCFDSTVDEPTSGPLPSSTQIT